MKEDKSAELLEEVRRQMGDGKFSRAFATLKDLLASNPSHQEGRRLLATLLLKFGNLATAKNAFETLVKEALGRRDYAEAESLLHEYLMAGPRCVSFIEMLGAAYELKGDPLAAVFEYEKAIDILLEDPDPERPTYAQDLFQKIKQLAPSSFVANRVAARLQPQTAIPPQAPALPEAPTDIELEPSKATAPGPTETEQEDDADQPLPEIEDAVEETDDEDVAGVEETLSDDIQESPHIQSSASSQITPTPSASDEKVPFPPVNQIAQQIVRAAEQTARPNPSTAGRDTDEDEKEFGSEPVCEPSHVGFYSQESEQAVPSTDTASPPMKEAGAWESREFKRVAQGNERESKQDSYWERVTGGMGSSFSVQRGSIRAQSSEEFAATTFNVSKSRRRYGSDMARWLAFRLSILSRRVVAMTNSFTKLTVFVAVAIVVWIMLIVGGIAWTWLALEQKTSDTFQRLVSVSPTKTIDDWKNNGYILLTGFGSPASVDPMQAGYDRWLSPSVDSSHGCLDRSATSRSITRRTSGSEQTGEWFKTPDPSAQMAADGARIKEQFDPQGLFVNRYRRWLNLPFEDWGFNYPGSPDCGQILTAHRLYLAEGFTQGFTSGLDRLETDLAAWRKVLAQSKTLSAKVMASEGINDDLAVMAGILNRSNVEHKGIQRMMRMARPLDPEERSLRWPMQNEFALAVKRMEARVRPRAGSDPFLTVAVAKMPLPKQRTLNAYAAYYDALIKGAATPNSPIPKPYDFTNAPSRTWLDHVFNPIDNLMGADPMIDWEAASGTIMETDARLRLAGLQARLRASSSDSNLVARIAQAGPSFYDPFTELPMLVNTHRGVLYSVGMDHKDDGGDPTFDVSVPFAQ